MVWVYLALFAGVGGWLSLIDLRTHTLPDRITLPATVGSVTLSAMHSFVSWDASPILRNLGGMLLMFCVFYLIAWASRGSLGGGDVKFAGFLGGVVGVVTAPWWALGAAGLSFIIGGVTSVLAMLIWRKPADTKIAFGPSMFVASACILLCAIG